MSNDYHIPVMLAECIEGLSIKPEGVYVDVTLGGGGHTRAIAAHLGKEGKVYSFDQDDDAINRTKNTDNIQTIKSNFKHIKKYLKLYGVSQIDGLLADLGVSSHQIDLPERGFSHRYPEEKLDMRMSQSGELTAADILNEYSERDLHRILGIYGEIKNAKSLAAAIVRGRINKKYEFISDLLNATKDLISKKTPSKYLSQVFQALRIEVNQEMEVLEEMLLQAAELLKPEGRLVVMSYHSLEDRIVKNLIQKGKFKGEVESDLYGNKIKPLEAVNRKLIMASEEEIIENKRARSAKLRIAKKLDNNWQRISS